MLLNYRVRVKTKRVTILGGMLCYALERRFSGLNLKFIERVYKLLLFVTLFGSVTVFRIGGSSSV